MADAPADLVRRRFEESVAVKQAMIGGEHVGFVVEAADVIVGSLREGGKALFCGNGGSAADAMHLAAEFLGRFKLERSPLPSVSLSDNVSAVTAIGNDYDYSESFSRQVRGLARQGDVLVALSTSGTSRNVVAAVDAAVELGVRTIGLTGEAGGDLAERCELCLRVPSGDTARIQEGSMLAAHTICELVERALAQ